MLEEQIQRELENVRIEAELLLRALGQAPDALVLATIEAMRDALTEIERLVAKREGAPV